MTLNTETTYPVNQFRKYVLTQNIWNRDCLRKSMAKGPCSVSLVYRSCHSTAPGVGGGYVLFCIHAHTHIYSHTYIHTHSTVHTHTRAHIYTHTIHHTHTFLNWQRAKKIDQGMSSNSSFISFLTKLSSLSLALSPDHRKWPRGLPCTPGFL